MLGEKHVHDTTELQESGSRMARYAIQRVNKNRSGDFLGRVWVDSRTLYKLQFNAQHCTHINIKSISGAASFHLVRFRVYTSGWFYV